MQNNRHHEKHGAKDRERPAQVDGVERDRGADHGGRHNRPGDQDLYENAVQAEDPADNGYDQNIHDRRYPRAYARGT